MAAGLEYNIPKSLKAPLKPSEQTEPCQGTEQACARDPSASGSSWISAVCFIILAANCAAAIYHSRGDPWAVVFILCSFGILLSLFFVLRAFEKSPRGSSSRAHSKTAVWVLSTALTLMFSVRVASLMPFPAAIIVWVMAGSTISAGFFMFFICPEGAVSAAEEPMKAVDIA